MSSWQYSRLDTLGGKDRPVFKAGPFGSSVKKENYIASGYKVYGQQEVLSGNINAKDYYIDQKAFERHKSCSVQEGDILITMMGTVGKIFVIPADYEPGIINPRLMRISLDRKQVDPEFVKVFLETPKLQNLFERRSHGGTMPGLNASAIGSITIPVPDLNIQKYIVEVLGHWDTAIEQTKVLIDAKERQFRWLITKLINGQKEHLTKLGEHFGRSIIIEKGKPLIKTDISDNGNIPVIAGGKTSPYTHNRYTHSMPCITVSASGAYAGYVWYHDYPIWASDCNIIYSTENSTRYIYFALKFNQSRIYALQSGGGQPHIYARDLRRIAIPLPNITEQKRIAEILNAARHEIDQLKSLAKQYGMQKRGLMQKLLTGKWRIDNG